MQHWEINEWVFKHPFNAMITGPSQSGKSFLLNKIILNKDRLIKPNIDRIYYCYSNWSSDFSTLSENQALNITFNKGIIELDDVDKSKNTLIILDDLMDEVVNDREMMKLFTVHTHHLNMSVIFLTQNLYQQGKHSRTISLNCHYLIIFKNFRDSTQINTLSRQMFPNKYRFLPEAFEDATSSLHGYLFIDLMPGTPNCNRIQTDIIPDVKRVLYTPKE